jgi:hypothetical protein
VLAIIAATLRDESADRPRDAALPDLRAGYQTFERACAQDPDSIALLAELDEIVDAANTLAALVGVDSFDTARRAVAAQSPTLRPSSSS